MNVSSVSSSRVGNRFIQRLLDMAGGRAVGRLTLRLPDQAAYVIAN